VGRQIIKEENVRKILGILHRKRLILAFSQKPNKREHQSMMIGISKAKAGLESFERSSFIA